MIVNHVPELAARKFGGADKINVTELQKDLGLSYNTVTAWVKGRVDRVDFRILEHWCAYFQCEVGDILEYRPDP